MNASMRAGNLSVLAMALALWSATALAQEAPDAQASEPAATTEAPPAGVETIPVEPQAEPAAEAPAAPDGEFLDLDLKQLSELTVTSVSKKAEPLSRAPAAVYVITSDQIRRSAARTLPELLRNVPGLHVARINSHLWAISARGFNSPLADKLEVLQDGRTLYTPLFSGVRWDEQGYALADIERIEIIRGPGGTLWGANAVNGVINIITKSAADTQGLLVEGTVGGEFKDVATVRYGFSPLGAAVRGYVHHQKLDSTEYAGTGGDARDGWDQARGGLRADWKGWTLQGDAYQGTEDDPAHGGIDVDGYFAQIGKIVDHDSGRQEQYQVYFDSSSRDIRGDFAESRQTVNADFQQHIGLGWVGDLVWGAGYRRSSDDLRNSATLIFTPESRTVELFSGFLQDQLRFGDDFSLMFGTKVESNDFTGLEIQPDLRFSWAVSEQTTLWGAVARAVRTPSRFDNDITFVGGGGGTPEDTPLFGGFGPGPVGEPTVQECIEAGGSPPLCALVFDNNFPLFPENAAECLSNGLPSFVCTNLFPSTSGSDLFGNRHFGPEQLLSYQLGWRTGLGEHSSVDLALFYNDYDDLRGIEHEGNDVRISNTSSGVAFGGELFVAWQPAQRWQLRGGYSYLNLTITPHAGSTDDRTKASERNDPNHQLFLRADWQALDSFALQGGARHVSALEGQGVPSYTEVDLGAAWRPLSWLRVSVEGQNLLHDSHREFGGRDTSRISREYFLSLRLEH